MKYDFFQIWKMLWDKKSWKQLLPNREPDWLRHESGLEFYLECNGASFRKNGVVVYYPTLLPWLLLHIPCARLRRHFRDTTP